MSVTKPPLAEWGRRLQDIRTERGISQGKLARLLEIDPGYLSRIERGQYGVSDELRIRIATALDVEVSDIWAYPETRAS